MKKKRIKKKSKDLIGELREISLASALAHDIFFRDHNWLDITYRECFIAGWNAAAKFFEPAKHD